MSDTVIAPDLRERHEQLSKQLRGSKAQQRYAQFTHELIERVSKAEARNELLLKRMDETGDDRTPREVANLLRWNEEKAIKIAQLEAKLAALDWTPITESNLPKAGDEVMRFQADKIRQTVYAVDGTEEQNTLIICLARGDTHFRPINPPQPTVKEEK